MSRTRAWFLRPVTDSLRCLEARLDRLEKEVRSIVPTVQEVLDVLNSTTAVIESIAADKKVLADKIAALQGQIDAGGAVDLTEVLSIAQAQHDRLAGIDASVPNP